MLYHQTISSTMKTIILIFFSVISLSLLGQKELNVTLGHTTPTTSQLMIITENIDRLSYSINASTDIQIVKPTFQDTVSKKIINYFKLRLNGLTPNSTNSITYSFGDTERQQAKIFEIKTPSDEQIFDYSFQFGSCLAPFKGAFVGLKPRLKIFDTMREQEADFMLWMGDNIYFLSGEWNEYDAMISKMLDYRTERHLKKFYANQPNYAIWDDHDFGPNNSHSDFENKEMTLHIFQKFWENPEMGKNSTKGISHNFTHGDAEFFMMDCRYHRVQGEVMFGEAQMNWLKEGLTNSNATFKFIVSGTQFIPHGLAEDLGDYPKEKEDFFQFIENESISGVVLLSGDTHYTELNKLERENSYSIFEVTSSALTSPTFPGASKVNDSEEPNTFSKKKNFGQIYITGKEGNRLCQIIIRDKNGKTIWQHQISENELK